MISIGRIKKFKYAGTFDSVNKESVWMFIVDMGNEKTTEWISVTTWYNRFKPKQETKPANDRSKKSKTVPESPI